MKKAEKAAAKAEAAKAKALAKMTEAKKSEHARREALAILRRSRAKSVADGRRMEQNALAERAKRGWVAAAPGKPDKPTADIWRKADRAHDAYRVGFEMGFQAGFVYRVAPDKPILF